MLLITYLKRKPKEIEKKENDGEIEEVIDANEHEVIRAQALDVKETNDLRTQTMQDTDIRQFKGRKDVTIDEVVSYMIDKSQYIGLEKRKYQMERITQVCNLTEDDMDEVFHQIWGKCKINEDEEGRRINEYNIKQIKRNIPEKSIHQEIREELLKGCETEEEKEKVNQFISEKKVNELENEDFFKNEELNRAINYDLWLKKKGYIQ